MAIVLSRSSEGGRGLQNLGLTPSLRNGGPAVVCIFSYCVSYELDDDVLLSLEEMTDRQRRRERTSGNS